MSYRLCCVECGGVHEEDPALLVCPACAGRQLPGGHIRGVLLVEPESLPGRWPESPLDLPAWLPLPTGLALPHHPVGATPLLPVPALRRHLGMPRLWVKDDTRNPSGSTKDRASWLVCAKALQYGLKTVATASTGNAATALASCAAAMGLRAAVFVPASAPAAKLLHIRACGAMLLAVEGSYDDAFELSTAACRSRGWYNRNTALNPYTIEGKKTAALELMTQAPDHALDVVLTGAGDGVILGGLGKGLADLARAGLLMSPPRLLAVQAGGSDALARGWEAGRAEAARVPSANSVADSLNVEAPRNAIHALQTLRGTKGGCVRVSDDEVRAAVALLGAATGIFAEPAGAAALAGLIRALELGLVDRGERVALLVTGQGLKDPAAAAAYFPTARHIGPRGEDLPEEL
ncbi:MAG: pyridoxal-phosphate dependent enzyme [bacterium]|nr:pyridoxal-phosphate dependent enzyme [bacterium]